MRGYAEVWSSREPPASAAHGGGALPSLIQRQRRRGHRDEDVRAVLAAAESAAAAEVEASLAVPEDPTAAAFFDVDNTIMMGASIYHFAKGLAARDYFTTADLL